MMEEGLQAQVEIGIGKDTDRDLIDAAIGGDVQAFAALYDRHMERVYRHSYFLVGNRADAEDLTQQVFLNAWRAIGRYQHTGASFAAWLFRIAHNQAMSLFRKEKDVSYLEIDLVGEGNWTDPEAQALAQYDRMAVRRAILCLKPEQQQVITMRFLEFLDYADIAAALGKSEGNIRVIQHRAIANLRRLLATEVIE